jgi:hypothetical protein
MSLHSPIPAQLTAGDDWAFTFASLAASWPAPAYALALALAPAAGGPGLGVPGAFEDGAWAARVVAAADGARQTVARGGFELLPDPLASDADRRSDAERILAAIEARIEGRISKDADSYSIEGRSISRMPMEQLLRLRGIYQREVAADRARREGRMVSLFTQRRMAIK